MKSKNTTLKEVISNYNFWSNKLLSSWVKVKNQNIKEFSDLPQTKLMNISVTGINMITSCLDLYEECEKIGNPYIMSYEESKCELMLFSYIFHILSLLNLRALTLAFPMGKLSETEKKNHKDYLSTISRLSMMDFEQPIGVKTLFELLPHYQNKDLKRAYNYYITSIKTHCPHYFTEH